MAQKKEENIMLEVYLDDGRVCQYEVANDMKAREFAFRIIDSGLRVNDETHTEWYPPHRISKVKFPNSAGSQTSKYPNKWRAT